MSSALTLQLRKGCIREDLEPYERPIFERLKQKGILEKEGELYKLGSLYRVGRIHVKGDGYGYVEADEEYKKDLLINPQDIGDANDGDIVLVKRIIARRGRASAKVIEVIERARELIVACVSKVEGQTRLIDLKSGAPFDLQIEGLSLSSLEDGAVLVIDALSKKLERVLGNIGDPKVDEDISLLLYKRRKSFRVEVVDEALNIPKEVDTGALASGVDLRALDFCTIDPVSAKDFDDAIYYDQKAHILYVAIADVSSYVSHFSEIDKEARLRGFTTYFPHKAIPMLPRELSEHICSLKPKVDRLAFVVKLELDPKTNEVAKESFFEAVIHSKHRFNYDEVDTILQEGYVGNDEAVARIIKWLVPLYRLTRIWRTRRFKEGFDFRTDETRITLDAAHRLIDTRIETGTPSHSLIEECMLLANKAAAKRFEGEGDGIFRIHEPPEITKLEELLTQLSSIGIFVEEYEDAKTLIRAIQKEAKRAGLEKEVDALIIKSLKQASYSAYNVGHFGLGFSHYSHFTSPIRRYSDLVLHRLIKAQLNDDEEALKYLTRNLEPMALKVSTLERNSAKCEWDFRDRKFARWADEHKGEVFEAEVTEVSDDKAYVVITDKKAPQGMVAAIQSDEVMLFDKVEVRITQVDLMMAKVGAEPVRKLSKEAMEL